jgi:hypothetical protein
LFCRDLLNGKDVILQKLKSGNISYRPDFPRPSVYNSLKVRKKRYREVFFDMSAPVAMVNPGHRRLVPGWWSWNFQNP